jgi:bile-salt sulfotransferase
MKSNLIHVYSHPRSGTNMLMAFIGKNFYPGMDLSTPLGRIGHWADRVRGQLNPYGKLAGHHHFYGDDIGKFIEPACYIYRDGRSVAVSLWKTKQFMHPDWRDMSFSEFLRKPLDWLGSPGRDLPDDVPRRTIAEHWLAHIESWRESGNGVLLVRYEDLLRNPLGVSDDIARWSGVNPTGKLHLIDELVGWYPNDGSADSWREVFSDADAAFFHQIVPRRHWGLWE